MHELKSIHSAMTHLPQPQTPEFVHSEVFRTQITRSVVSTYNEATRKLVSGETLPFNPRELSASGMIDIFSPTHFVGITVADVDEFERLQYVDEMAPPTNEQMEAAMKLYPAMLLGLLHSTVKFDKTTGNVGSYFEIPEPERLPLQPLVLADGSYETNDAERYAFTLNDVLADSIFAGHFIAENRDLFRNQYVITELIREITIQADQGEILLRETVENMQGLKSLVRQIAHSLGYIVGSERYVKTSEGYSLAILGSRPGFSTEATPDTVVEQGTSTETSKYIALALGNTAV